MDKNDNKIILNVISYIKEKREKEEKENRTIWKKVGAGFGVVHYALKDSILEDIKEKLNNNILTVVNTITIFSEKNDLRIYLRKNNGYRILLKEI